MGDDFFNGMFPFIDLEGGGSVRGYIAALEKVLPDLKADVRIIPGHGPLATKADLQGYLAMLKETTAIVDKGLQQGKTTDQLKKEKVLAAYDAKWGAGFIKTDGWIDALVNGLTGVAKNP